MASDAIKTSVLYQVGNYKVFINEYNPVEQEAINELLDEGFLRLVSDNLQLTAEGDLITRYNRDYRTIIDKQKHDRLIEDLIYQMAYKDEVPKKIKTDRLQRKFLEFLDGKTTALCSDIDVEEFMVSNFEKPDATSPATINSNDEGVIFLKTLKAKKLIIFDDVALSHVNHWTIEGGANGKTKRWFDTLHEPLLVTLNYNLYNRVLSPRLLNNKLVLNTIKKVTPVLTKTGIKVLRYISAFSIAFLSGLLLIDHNYIKFWDWLKSIFLK